jgi:hypothetical protein
MDPTCIRSMHGARRRIRLRTIVVLDGPACGAMRVVCRGGEVVLGLRLAAAANVKLLLDLVHVEAGYRSGVVSRVVSGVGD